MLQQCDQRSALGYTPNSYSLQNQQVDTFAIEAEPSHRTVCQAAASGTPVSDSRHD
jgi:hypothetical protein